MPRRLLSLRSDFRRSVALGPPSIRARALSTLDGLDREASLYEIAILTHAGPARILGIRKTHGQLGPGAMADVTVYADHPDRERMFAHPLLLLKAGRPVMRDGEVLEPNLCGGTHVVRSGYDAAIRGRVGRFFEDYRDMRLGTFELADHEIEDGGRGCVVVRECGGAPPWA